jgi:transcriptional regulator with XRE-family HTH domain
MDAPEITSSALRKARNLLGWTQKELAARARVGRETVQLHESRQGYLEATPRVVTALRTVLEEAGIEFTASGSARLRAGRNLRREPS